MSDAPAPLAVKIFIVLLNIALPIGMACIGKRLRIPMSVWLLSLVLYSAGKTWASVSFVRDHYLVSLLASFGADCVFTFLNSDYFNDGQWKDRWGKIKSAALTAVNQASFKEQQREAFQ